MSALDRRQLLTGLATASLVVGLDAQATVRSAAEAVRFSPFIEITPRGDVVFRIGQSEMGQGITTGLAMIGAEELDADWSRVSVVFATGPAFKHPVAYAQPPLTGEQITGGSLSTLAFSPRLRQAGAATRDMLKSAAAQRWGVPAADLVTEASTVRHPGLKLAAAYGDLVEAARRLPAPKTVTLKPRDEWRIVGRAIRRLDTPDKVTGRAVFGMDVDLPGMLYGAVRHAPVFGAVVAHLDARAALALAGVKTVTPFHDPGEQAGVIVVADSYWTAQRGADLLEVAWTATSRDSLSSDDVEARLAARLDEGPAATFLAQGAPDAALAAAAQRHVADFAAPYLAHACMEPMNATASVRDDRCELWAPTQRPDFDRTEVARVLGLDPARVSLNLTFLGGGFGRRGGGDFAVIAALASRAAGAPVKVIWSRAEDMRHDHYRPAMMVRHEAALDAQGDLTALTTRVAGPGIWRQNRPVLVSGGIDYMAIEGLGESYPIANHRIDWAETAPDAKIGFWRGVGASHNVMFTEAMVDELAELAGSDPVAYRRRLLQDDARSLAVLDRVAALAQWTGSSTEAGGRGVAFYQAKRWQTRVAQIVEVVRDGRTVRPTKVWCAVDSGLIVNPNQAHAQVCGAILFGLSAALWGEITFRNGTPVQSSFADYRVVRLAEAPQIEVSFLDGGDAPGSIGEIGAPAVGPALMNAVWAATGRRLRALPLARAGLA